MSESKEIIFGTKNPAKIDQVRDVLYPLGINVVGIGGFGELPEVEEDGTDVVKNAIKKAVAYAYTINRTVLSMDNGLLLDGLPDDQQPGTHVRRINGEERASDRELLEQYVDFAARHGGTAKACWQYGLAIAKPSGEYSSTSFTTPRIFTSKPSQSVIKGYPLESIQIDPDSGIYVSEMSDEQRAAFWQRTIGKMLGEFVIKNI